MLRRRIEIALSLFLIAGSASTPLCAQYFEFSQYNFTPQRINPAQVGSTNYASLSAVYRNQSTAGGFHLSSNIVNISYPFIAKNGTRWSGIGISLMDDRSGSAGIFKTQEAALSYAINVPIAKDQTLSLGMKVLYQSWRINLDGLYTGSQYVPDRGFDTSLSQGEIFTELRNNFVTFSSGLYWQRTDRKGKRIAYWGLSIFDFNKPKDSFLGSLSRLNSTFVGSFGFRAYQKENLSILPEILFTRGASLNVINIGCITRYNLPQQSDRASAYIDILTKYVINRSGIIGVQLHNENFSIGFSYDLPMAAQNVANTGAFELGIELRRLVKPKKAQEKPNQQKALSKNKPVPTKPVQKSDTSRLKKESSLHQGMAKKETMSQRLQQKQDSIDARATAGAITFEALVLEKSILHVNFKFNSTDLDLETIQYLDDLARALTDNPQLKIRLTGHTDNIGSQRFNQKLSVYRAETIRELLVEKGIDKERITVEGKGMKEPLNDNRTEEDRARNRRVELIILYEN